MSTHSKPALKRSSTSREPEASRKRPIGHPDGSPSNDSRGAQIQTAINHYSTKSGEGNKQISLQNGPAKKAAWGGIVEFDYYGMRLSEDMSAHPSAIVSQKAYVFSKNLKPVLHFKLLPRREGYPRIFKDSCPNRDDVALYFYPAKVDRPKGIYAEILRSMKDKHLMMQSCIDGVELLMFPSTVLPADSQLIDGSYFIWGVFCREEDAKKKAVGLAASHSVKTPVKTRRKGGPPKRFLEFEVENQRTDERDNEEDKELEQLFMDEGKNDEESTEKLSPPVSPPELMEFEVENQRTDERDNEEDKKQLFMDEGKNDEESTEKLSPPVSPPELMEFEVENQRTDKRDSEEDKEQLFMDEGKNDEESTEKLSPPEMELQMEREMEREGETTLEETSIKNMKNEVNADVKFGFDLNELPED